MEDPAFQQKYQKYKLKVKLWEKDFKETNGRIPSKYDIRDASREIRESYKMYYKLKTSFLENTLNDVLAEDGFNVLEESQMENGDASLDESFPGSTGSISSLPFDISAIALTDDANKHTRSFTNVNDQTKAVAEADALGQHVIKDFEPTKKLPLNENAWGSSVSKVQEIRANTQETTSLNQKKPLKLNLNEKLFKTNSFTKRNPRKSLSHSGCINSSFGSQNQMSLDVTAGGDAPREVLPDLEMILAQKSKEQQTVGPLLFIDKSKETIKTHVDEGWLHRNTLMNVSTTLDIKSSNACKSIEDGGYEMDKRRTYGLSNMDVSNIIPIRAPPQPLQKVTENFESTVKTTPSEKMDTKCPDWSKKEDGIISSDSDAIVANSEEEQETPNYRHIVKRRRILEAPCNETKPHDAKHPQASDRDKSGEGKAQNKEPSENNFENKTEENGFSADDTNKDEDYVPDTLKKQRKKVRAKRVKPAKNENQKPEKSKKSKTNKAGGSKVSNRRPMKSKNNQNSIEENESEERKPCNIEDLKYTLALERGDIVAVPRISDNDLESVDSLAERYIKTSAPASTGGKTEPGISPAINEKREKDRRKLQEKINSGKLNENFVTINIQKKVFVRGKKTVNFSKYKKKLWKQQKQKNALAGPNMNMGGCDGGVLTCFNCGQIGHFAQKCKLKGDSLLPLTAHIEEDASPFPTLEEAEKMAKEGAVAAHSRNITKLPSATNPAIYSEVSSTGPQSNGRNETLKDDTDHQKESSADEELLIETDEEFEGMSAFSEEAVTKNTSPVKTYIGHKIPEEFLKRAGLDEANIPGQSKFGVPGPMYNLNSDGTVKGVTSEVIEVLRMFGHTDFRKGQDRAVMRILSGQSTLVTLSTGSGKSLCYQLPAYMYSRQMKSITLVISPLVSLMEDQVTDVPHFLRAHCLHTNQTPQQRLKVLSLINEGEIDILLVSPEAVVAGERSTGFGSILRRLPPIAFACIDEVHCVSQWSHNFRPSYLMICKVLKNNLGIKTVLGLTATATLPTRLSVIKHLGISGGESGVISDVPLPDNLILSISKDENRDRALISLLHSERFKACQSIIIYCTRREECERVAGFIRACMKFEPETEKRKRKRVNWNAEAYHAGLAASRRRTIQSAFMKNELRIVVATIAFGMGINKSDIRSVIHYNMPRNFESYVQEIGRAGRDGKPAHCHLFLDARGNDQNELRRHIYANSIDRHVIRKLLQRLFVSCSCHKNLENKNVSAIRGKTENNATETVLDSNSKTLSPLSSEADNQTVRKHLCPGHEIGFSIEKTVEALDIPEENISTLLCYMELDARWNISVLSSAYVMAKVISYGGAKYLKHAAKECPPLAMAIALKIRNNCFDESSNVIEFSVVDIAAAIGWNSGVVKYQLKNLEWISVNGNMKRSPMTVNFFDLGFRIRAPGDFTTEEIDEALDSLYNRSVKQEKTQLIQLQCIFQSLSSVAFDTYVPCTGDNFSIERSDRLKALIRDYFINDYPKDVQLITDDSTVPDDLIINDVHAMINMYPENNFSGRNLARIFHGISSPNYPALIWSRCKYWRAHSKVDFNRIVQLGNAVIVKFRT